jgi:hypothetical protein
LKNILVKMLARDFSHDKSKYIYIVNKAALT